MDNNLTTGPSNHGDDLAHHITGRLAQHVGPRKFAMWFERSARLGIEQDTGDLCVSVPNRFVADWIQRHFTDELRRSVQDTWQDRFGRSPNGFAVRFVVDEQRFERDELQRSVAARTAAAGPAGGTTPPANGYRPHGAPTNGHARHGGHDAAAPGTVPGLRPIRMRHELDDFVVGPSNELAFAAAEELAAEDDPGHPLFLHGGCGLGKTHLVQGVCQKLLHRRPVAKVLYTTGEQFTNAYITAVRSNKLDAFRRAVRSLDLLAVDDVHFIANKQATQQEFLHSFEQIELTGARLVLASDQHPKAIEQFSEGLASRCVRGLVVQLRKPDPITRRRLVQALAKRRGLVVTDVVIDVLAQRWTGSIRELEGLLAKLRALASLQHGRFTAPIGRALVEQLFRSDTPDRPQAPVRFEDILAAVIGVTGVAREAILGRGRQQQVVLARSLLIHIARKLTSLSYPELAAAMGKRNHSTVITADQRMHRQLAAGDPAALPVGDRPSTPRELYAEILRRLGHEA